MTQAFYCLIFFARYLDYFIAFSWSNWNTAFKTFYILTSIYVLFLMLFVYARTREREKAWKLAGFCLAGAAVGAPIVMVIHRKGFYGGFFEVCIPCPPLFLFCYHESIY